MAVPREGRAGTRVDCAAVCCVYMAGCYCGVCADAASLGGSIRAGRVVSKGEARWDHVGDVMVIVVLLEGPLHPLAARSWLEQLWDDM